LLKINLVGGYYDPISARIELSCPGGIEVLFFIEIVSRSRPPNLDVIGRQSADATPDSHETSSCSICRIRDGNPEDTSCPIPPPLPRPERYPPSNHRLDLISVG